MTESVPAFCMQLLYARNTVSDTVCNLRTELMLESTKSTACQLRDDLNEYKGVQRPGKPRNVREFRCKEKKSWKKSQGIYKKQSQGILL